MDRAKHNRIIASAFVAFLAVLLIISRAATAGISAEMPPKITSISNITKAEFLEYLNTESSMLIGFFEKGQEESDIMLHELEVFAGMADKMYPEMKVGKVYHKDEPYLTFRMLLKSIPELHFVTKNSDGKWVSHSIDPVSTADHIADYVDNQAWVQYSAIENESAICTPFNVCGRALGAFAEFSVTMENALPIPSWLAAIIIPALITAIVKRVLDILTPSAESGSSVVNSNLQQIPGKYNRTRMVQNIASSSTKTKKN